MSKPLSVTNSSVTNITNSESYKSNFDNFTTILSKYPNIVSRCKIILIPGKNDPWQSTYSLGSSSLNYFPQSSIPKVFINRLKIIAQGKFSSFMESHKNKLLVTRVGSIQRRIDDQIETK